MSGTISFSLSQQFDTQGRPLSGGLFYTFVAGTTSTPQNAYQDSALSIAHPNPIVLDSAGRIPQFFLADGLIKIRLTDHAGVTQLVADNILVIGPSSGSGGGGGTVDPTTIYQTGDLKPRYGTGFHTGWVRANGGSIGSATSTGASGLVERANSDCQALFEYLWTVDSLLIVSGIRGATAHADWLANKQIALPDYRSYALSGLDGMGNVAANRLAGFFANADTLGSAGGAASFQITDANLPAYTPAGTIANGAITSTFTAAPGQVVLNNSKPTGSAYFGGGLLAEILAGTVTSTQAVSSFTGTAATGRSQTPFGIISPTKLCTIYLKL